jgi:hypothetical protein
MVSAYSLDALKWLDLGFEQSDLDSHMILVMYIRWRDLHRIQTLLQKAKVFHRLAFRTVYTLFHLVVLNVFNVGSSCRGLIVLVLVPNL